MSEFASIHEAIGTLKATAKAAHDRIDDVQHGVREDLAKINEKLDSVIKWMHQTQAKTQVIMLAIGASGALAVELIKYAISKGGK